MSNFFSKLFSSAPSLDFKELTGKGAVIVDVRTPAEFNTGHLKGAVNIPLDSINKQIEKIRKTSKPVIAVCRSGSRSGIAVNILKSAGIEAYNGGAWDELQTQIA
jgi:rhodanese-related sulfurtransferase